MLIEQSLVRPEAFHQGLRLERDAAQDLLWLAHRSQILSVYIHFQRAAIAGGQGYAGFIGRLVGVARLQASVEQDGTIRAFHGNADRAAGAEDDPGTGIQAAESLAGTRRYGGLGSVGL